jgi:hypothetical protein
MKKPTPETDAVAAYEGNWDTKALRMTVHARKLERERDEAREEIRDWKRLHDAAERGVDLTIAEGTIYDLLKQRDEARRELKFLWRERDEALMALKCIDEAILVMKPRHIGQPDMDGRYPCWSVWLPKSGRVERKSLQDALLEFAAQIKEETK